MSSPSFKYNELNEKYGHSVLENVREAEKLSKSYGRHKSHLYFATHVPVIYSTLPPCFSDKNSGNPELSIRDGDFLVQTRYDLVGEEMF